MNNGLYVIVFVLFLAALIILGLFKQKRSKKDGPDSQALWKRYGGHLKWWALILNSIGTIILLKELLFLRGLQGGKLAQWQIGVGFTYQFYVFPPTLLVIVCLILYLRFEIAGNDSRRKVYYLFIAVLSILIPLLLVSNASLFME